jgi:hypothetical protein
MAAALVEAPLGGIMSRVWFAVVPFSPIQYITGTPVPRLVPSVSR